MTDFWHIIQNYITQNSTFEIRECMKAYGTKDFDAMKGEYLMKRHKLIENLLNKYGIHFKENDNYADEIRIINDEKALKFKLEWG